MIPIRLRTVLIFLVLLVPSGFYAWKQADMPEFGKLHDDGLLFVSGKSLANNQGYRILSLPEQPAQTKYPVLYPLYLSLIWRVNSHFPDNLITARWFSWPLLVLALALSWIYWREEKWSWIVVAILAISPYMILFGCGLFSEVFFLCWLLGALIIGSREGGRREGLAMALLAGPGRARLFDANRRDRADSLDARLLLVEARSAAGAGIRRGNAAVRTRREPVERRS